MNTIKNMLSILLMCNIVFLYAQDHNYHTAHISGAKCIIVDYYIDPYNSLRNKRFDFDNNLGTYYLGDDGVIHIELPDGYYQYMAVWENHEPQHGSFHLFNRDIYFEINLLPPFCGLDTEKMVSKACSLAYEGHLKEARALFYDAANSGNVEAMFHYSTMCRIGEGGKTDKNHALHWMKRALERGHPYASHFLQNFDDKKFWKMNGGTPKKRKFATVR